MVLPAIALRGAREIAERLRRSMADGALLTAPALVATVSIGAAQFTPGLTPQQLLNMADDAVYVAKNSGRSQVRASEPVLATAA